MTRKLVACCLWLVSLGGSAAQTPPRKQPAPHPPAVRKRAAKSPLPTRPTRTGTETAPEEVIYNLPCQVTEEPIDSDPLLTYAEQMPILNGQEASAGSRQAIRQLMAVPADAPAGWVFVYFEVDKQGCVRHPEVFKGLRADVDSAVVRAVRQLPDFTAGRQSGQPVRVSLTVAVPFP